MTFSEIALIIFLSISAAVFVYLSNVLYQYFQNQKRINENLDITLDGEDTTDLNFRRSSRAISLLKKVEDIAARSGDRQASNSKLQLKLMRAGFFNENAVLVYRFARILFATLVPIVVLLSLYPMFAKIDMAIKLLFGGLVYLLVFSIPEVLISRRTEAIQSECRRGFPDFLDLMVVATEAGLSFEGALSRVSEEITRTHQSLGRILYLANIEIRLGKSLAESLQSLSDRAGIDEVKGFVTTLAQSREYGTSIAESLRVYSEDMRDKRQMTAEERAQELPVKMVFPLALFLLPVMLTVALWPVIVRIKNAFT